MKKVFIVAATMVMMALGIQADTATVNGITWIYNVSDGKASIYNGGSSAIPSTTSGSLTIPSSLGGYPVTSIGDRAFYNCIGLTSITIPNSVKSIGNNAFFWCIGLTSVTIGNSVKSIGNNAFAYCYKLVEVINKSSLSISKGSSLYGYVAYYALDVHSGESKIVNYNDYLFYTSEGVNYLLGYVGTATALTLPNKGENYKIYNYAFSGCSGLTSMTIPNSVTSIGDGAFYDCGGLTSVTIGNSVMSIGEYAFRLCSGLTSVTIPDSMTRIGDRAFYDCDGLTSVTIPNSVTSIGYEAFYDCDGLTSVTIPESVTSIGDKAFSGCSGLTSVTIPNSVTSIRDEAFYCCSKLKDIYFFGDAPRIGDDVFDYIAYNYVIWIKKGTYGWDGNYASTALPKQWRGYSSLGYLHTYTVYYYANGGYGTMSSQTMTYNVASKLRANAFNRTGYTFQGWAKSKTGAVAYKNAASVKNLTSSGTVTLYAIWKPNTYKVAFNANGGSGTMSAQTMGYDTWTKLRANAFKRTGYTFQGWAKSKTGAVAYKNAASVKNLASSGTVTLYAIWKPNTYKVAFNANGGKGKMSTSSMTYGKTAKLKKNTFKRSGYVFIGWAKSKKGAVAYKNAASVKNLRSSGTITLYAVWAKKNYKVAFYANGGKGKMSAQTFTYGKAAKLKKNAFKRSGYTFKGWAKSSALAKKGTVSYKNTQAIKNLVKNGKTVKLYAVWKRK